MKFFAHCRHDVGAHVRLVLFGWFRIISDLSAVSNKPMQNSSFIIHFNAILMSFMQCVRTIHGCLVRSKKGRKQKETRRKQDITREKNEMKFFVHQCWAQCLSSAVRVVPYIISNLSAVSKINIIHYRFQQKY